eukprot:TRINITY_DN8578_c0_g1_i1.p2 TRINITY_DN8578_c0_g1~~TRINITY_DN8578_c0_g1_i1.p2  ORF type:complete len:119 (+),score=20.93 TRINITY_DN8578_c0_g1_i1:126-482(+)
MPPYLAIEPMNTIWQDALMKEMRLQAKGRLPPVRSSSETQIRGLKGTKRADLMREVLNAAPAPRMDESTIQMSPCVGCPNCGSLKLPSASGSRSRRSGSSIASSQSLGGLSVGSRGLL